MGRNYLIPAGTGARVRSRRHELELTQHQLGERVARHVKMRYGVEKRYSDGWVRAIEGDKGSALLDAAIGLADALGVSMDWLYGRMVIAPDVVLEADGKTITRTLRDAAEAPLEEALRDSDTPAPIPLEPARRDRKRGGAQPRRT